VGGGGGGGGLERIILKPSIGNALERSQRRACIDNVRARMILCARLCLLAKENSEKEEKSGDWGIRGGGPRGRKSIRDA